MAFHPRILEAFIFLYKSAAEILHTYIYCNSQPGVFSHNVEQIRIERFHSRGQQPGKFIGTKESSYIRKEFNSHRIGLGHQHGRRFIVLGHQYGRRDVM